MTSAISMIRGIAGMSFDLGARLEIERVLPNRLARHGACSRRSR